MHEQDLADGYGRVELPHALAWKCPNANRDWIWQFVFLRGHRWVSAQTGEQGRHHVTSRSRKRQSGRLCEKPGCTRAR